MTLEIERLEQEHRSQTPDASKRDGGSKRGTDRDKAATENGAREWSKRNAVAHSSELRAHADCAPGLRRREEGLGGPDGKVTLEL